MMLPPLTKHDSSPQPHQTFIEVATPRCKSFEANDDNHQPSVVVQYSLRRSSANKPDSAVGHSVGVGLKARHLARHPLYRDT